MPLDKQAWLTIERVEAMRRDEGVGKLAPEIRGEREVEVVVGGVESGVADGGDDVGTDEVHELQTALVPLGCCEFCVDRFCKGRIGR